MEFSEDASSNYIPLYHSDQSYVSDIGLDNMQDIR